MRSYLDDLRAFGSFEGNVWLRDLVEDACFREATERKVLEYTTVLDFAKPFATRLVPFRL